MNMLMSSF